MDGSEVFFLAYTAKMANYLKAIAIWPLHALDALKAGSYLGTAAAIGVPYYFYGVPSFGDGLQAPLMWYGVAGLSFVLLESGLPALKSEYYGGPATRGGSGKPGPGL